MSLDWMLIRGSGIVAFALLTASVVWGLLVSSKSLGRLVKAKPLTWFHESLGISALIATIVHLGALAADEFIDFGWEGILVPGRSAWRPLAVTLGVVSFYALVVLVGSFYVRRFIGHKAWRTIHFGSLGLFVAALLHGMLAGTDTADPWMLGLYLGAAVVVFVLISRRMTSVPESAGTASGGIRPEHPDPRAASDH